MEKYAQLLKEVLKDKKANTPGLFFGNMGISMSLHLINKNLNDKEIEYMADDFLDKTIEAIITMRDISFDTGLTGIGWAMNYLHDNNCIEGDIDDILFNIDAMLYKILNTQNKFFSYDLVKGLTGLLVYFTYRLKNAGHNIIGIQHSIIEAALRIVIDKIEEGVLSKFGSMQKDLYSTILWDYPILFFCLGEVMNIGFYREKIEGMLNGWSYFFTSALPFSHINRLALANSLAYMNQELREKKVNTYIDTLFYSINFDDYLHDIDKMSITLNGDWFCALFNAYKALQLMEHNHIRYPDLRAICPILYENYCKNMNEKLSNLSDKECSNALINGISGTILAYYFFKNIYQGFNSDNI